jgi:hypothetical protein
VSGPVVLIDTLTEGPYSTRHCSIASPAMDLATLPR